MQAYRSASVRIERRTIERRAASLPKPSSLHSNRTGTSSPCPGRESIALAQGSARQIDHVRVFELRQPVIGPISHIFDIPHRVRNACRIDLKNGKDSLE